MKINTVDTVIQDFREGQNIFRRPSVELMVREISRLNKRLEQLEEINQAGRNCIAELEQERRWIPVGERLPEEYEYVLLWDRYNILVGNYVFDKDKPNWCDATSLNDIYPTHWQPLPQPPKEEE